MKEYTEWPEQLLYLRNLEPQGMKYIQWFFCLVWFIKMLLLNISSIPKGWYLFYLIPFQEPIKLTQSSDNNINIHSGDENKYFILSTELTK